MSFPEDPKDDGSKVPAATYIWMIPVISRVARRYGYAIAVHGSMSRDLDIIACAWSWESESPEELIKGIASAVEGFYGRITQKPGGRLACNIRFEKAWHFLDISIIPPLPAEFKSQSTKIWEMASLPAPGKTEEDADGYVWCDMCGYNAKLLAKDRGKIKDCENECPWCKDSPNFSFLSVADELPEHVAPDEPMRTWPEVNGL